MCEKSQPYSADTETSIKLPFSFYCKIVIWDPGEGIHCGLKCIIHAAYWEYAHGVSAAGEFTPAAETYWSLHVLQTIWEWMGREVMCKGGHKRMV